MDMNMKLFYILQSCDTAHEVEKELNSKFGFLKFKQKKEFKILYDMIEKEIKGLYDDKWDIKYLYELEYTLFPFYDKLKPFMDSVISFPMYKKETYDPKHFIPIYFIEDIKDRYVILDITGNVIDFTIFDNKTGNSFTSSSSDKTATSQQKIEMVCKQIFIERFLMEYLKNKQKMTT